MKSDLESKGWRQGSVVRPDDVPTILHDSHGFSEEAIVVVVSQSCDIARSVNTEPDIEVIVAEWIDSPNGNYAFAKNARVLDVTAKEATGELGTLRDKHIRLGATGKISISKTRFFDLQPDHRTVLPRADVDVLAIWLASRYSRPALPTAFNNALITADPKGKKLKKIAKRLSPSLSGLYVELHPNRDLRGNEKYSVNLLGTLLPNAISRKEEINKDVKLIQELMTDAGMEVQSAVQLESDVSITTIKSFQRMYLDDISLRNDDPLPQEVSGDCRNDTD